jgi:histidinol dehydrogenase
MKREDAPEVDDAVAAIIADVRSARRRGGAGADRALRPDGADRGQARLFAEAEIDAAIAQVPEEERAALDLAAARIRAYHERQLPKDESWVDETGATLGWRWSAVSAAGLYVPGGLASYPSSVLMNAIPAQVAGVERLVICAPTPDGVANPLVLLAARLSGVDTVYRIGGAQAVAAMAYGTETIAPVDKITGPGNAYVAAAKRRVFGRVGIDMIAGPSEILVIADAENDPDWIAVDLLSQAEHDESAQSILITDDAAFGQAVADAVDKRLRTLERRAIAGAVLARLRRGDRGAGPVGGGGAQRPDRARAPGALRGRPRGALRRITHAGAVFPRPMDAGGHRRLCRRAEPRPAHGTLGTVLLGPVGARLHETHDAGADDARGPARDRPRGRDAGAVRKPRGAWAFGARAAGAIEPVARIVHA